MVTSAAQEFDECQVFAGHIALNSVKNFIDSGGPKSVFISGLTTSKLESLSCPKSKAWAFTDDKLLRPAEAGIFL